MEIPASGQPGPWIAQRTGLAELNQSIFDELSNAGELPVHHGDHTAGSFSGMGRHLLTWAAAHQDLFVDESPPVLRPAQQLQDESAKPA